MACPIFFVISIRERLGELLGQFFQGCFSLFQDESSGLQLVADVVEGEVELIVFG